MMESIPLEQSDFVTVRNASLAKETYVTLQPRRKHKGLLKCIQSKRSFGEDIEKLLMLDQRWHHRHLATTTTTKSEKPAKSVNYTIKQEKKMAKFSPFSGSERRLDHGWEAVSTKSRTSFLPCSQAKQDKEQGTAATLQQPHLLLFSNDFNKWKV
ncbi:ubiquitin fusion degradation protein 1 isoform X2 [Salvia divinorum]|uniref:Ubiquitin fusion degradation protein 1 isoform X2 n=1 Tax=Salvia divinorum TaxID=28513 RepID=A0ABD1HTV3_SALDI